MDVKAELITGSNRSDVPAFPLCEGGRKDTPRSGGLTCSAPCKRPSAAQNAVKNDEASCSRTANTIQLCVIKHGHSVIYNRAFPLKYLMHN